MTEPSQLVLVQPEPQRNPPALTPMQLIQVATEKGADVATLERLMELQLKWEANEARKAYVEAKAAFYKEAPTIYKTKRVGFGDTAYSHATLDGIVALAAPILGKYGFTHSWIPNVSDAGVEVSCKLTHVLGHSETVSMRAPADGSGKKNAVQAVGSTLTYLERYTFMAVTGLAAKDQDKDGRTGADFITADQVAALKKTIDAAAKTLAGDFSVNVGRVSGRVLAALSVESLETIPASRFKEAEGKLALLTKEPPK